MVDTNISPPNSGGSSPPTGISGNNSYDPLRSLYNGKSAAMTGVRAALASALSGSGYGRLACCGDSTTAGLHSGNTALGSYPYRLNSLFGQAGYLIGEGLYPLSAQAGNDPRYAFTGSWQSGITSGANYESIANGSTATFVSTKAGTIVDIYYYNQNGTWSYQIDGGAIVPVTPGSMLQVVKVSVTGLPNTTHTVVITATAAGVAANMFCINVRSANGLDVSNFGSSGQTALTYLGASGWAAAVNNYLGIAPVGIAILCLGINDANQGLGVTEFINNMTSIINGFQTAGSQVMLMTPMTPSQPSDGQSLSIPTATWTQYRQATYGLADTFNLPLLDLSDRGGLWSVANGHGLMYTPADGFHPNGLGYEFMAQALYNVLVNS